MTAPTDLATLYRDHGHVVLYRAQQLLGDHDEAREVLQEVFTSLLTKLDRFHGKSSITTWLYSVTTNHCVNKIRNRKTRERLLDERVAPAQTEPAEPRSENLAAARRLLESMPEELAAVIVYYYVDEMSHEEIAEVLECSRRHVGNLLQRAQGWVRAREDAA